MLDRETLQKRQAAMRQRTQPVCVSIATGVVGPPPLTVQQAAARLGVSTDWIRSRFAKIPGTLIIPSLPRRGKRAYNTMLIPVEVFERTLQSWSVAA
jgi:hypothetical protein